MKLFVTGTDTNVGKSVVSAALTLGMQGAYWKPIQTGEDSDTQWVQQLTGLSDLHFFPESYHLTQPLSPHAAARIDGVTIDCSNIRMPACSLPLIIEGAGGVMVPLNETHLMVDLIKNFAIPVVIVSRSTLGTLNHTLLTIDKLRSSEIPILGVIMNGPKNSRNREAIEKYGEVEVLGEIEPLPELNQKTLLQAFQQITIQ